MKRKYTNDEIKKIIDLITVIATEIHESGVEVAEQLNMPMEIMCELEKCPVKVDMISPCMCEECKPVEIMLKCKQCQRFQDNSCPGTDYFRRKEHYYCIIDWKAFKNKAINTRFIESRSTVGTTGIEACQSTLNREPMKQEAPTPQGGSSQ